MESGRHSASRGLDAPSSPKLSQLGFGERRTGAVALAAVDLQGPLSLGDRVLRLAACRKHAAQLQPGLCPAPVEVGFVEVDGFSVPHRSQTAITPPCSRTSLALPLQSALRANPTAKPSVGRLGPPRAWPTATPRILAIRPMPIAPRSPILSGVECILEHKGGEWLPNPLAIGVTLGGLLLDVIAPRPKPRAGHSPELSLLSERSVPRTPRHDSAIEAYDGPPVASGYRS